MLVISPEWTELAEQVRTFTPEKVTVRAAERARRLAILRTPVAIAPGWAASLQSVPDSDAWEEGGQVVEIDLRINGESAHLRTVWTALEAFVYQAEPRVQLSDLDAELGAALIEAHVMDFLQAFEGLANATCAVQRISKVRDHAGVPSIDMNLSVNGSEVSYPASLYASPKALGLVATTWEMRPRVSDPSIPLTFTLAARVATSSVSRAGLSGLAAGDALLFDRVAPDGGIVICCGERLTAIGQITETGAVQPGSQFSATSPLSLGEFLMADDDFETESGTAALDDASIGNLPVRLVFELGRREVSLDELRDLGVGAPIPLDKPATSMVDILANGRRVGAGEMVLIGDQLGVRITRLNGHA